MPGNAYARRGPVAAALCKRIKKHRIKPGGKEIKYHKTVGALLT